MTSLIDILKTIYRCICDYNNFMARRIITLDNIKSSVKFFTVTKADILKTIICESDIFIKGKIL